MKRFGQIIAASAGALVVAVTSLTSCDAMWDTSMDVAPGYYGVGFDNEWLPSLPGAPFVSPVYWGGQIYPGSLVPPYRPPYRPDYRPTPMAPVNNGGVGNVRPVPTVIPSKPTVPVRPSSPSTPSVPSGGTIRPGNVTGGEPGIAMPPAGMGYRPGRH